MRFSQIDPLPNLLLRDIATMEHLSRKLHLWQSLVLEGTTFLELFQTETFDS